ncbi:metabotropic glutamate receptor 2 isoform X1 [Penaeus vannamei]|uniref:metabotropic glutamate receptor 2 isoform X1 n=1 Tax=Penaeus vannamei TaxID=6689 RepID=UPI00387F8530
MNLALQVALLALTASVTSSLDLPPLVLPGDVVVGIVADLHGRGFPQGGCGAVGLRAVEEVAAAEWALATINNQSQHDYTIGLRVYDACGDEDAALRQTVRLLQDTQPPNPPLLGVVALGSSRVASGTAAPLHAFTTPILVTDARAAHTITPADNVFTTAPHLTDQLQAVLATAVRLGGAGVGVSVVSSCDHATRVLQERAARAGIKILHTLQAEDATSLGRDVARFVTGQVGYGGVVVVLLSAAEINLLTAELEVRLLRKLRLRWVLTTLDGEPSLGGLHEEQLRKKLPGSLLVEAHSPVIPGFTQYFASAVADNTSVVAPLARRSLRASSHCDPEVSDSPCSMLNADDVGRLVSGAPTTATVKAVSSLAAAFRLVQIERCSKGVHCLQALRQDLHEDVLKALLKLSFTVGGGADRIRYTADGRLVNTFTIKRVSSEGLRQVGVYREDTGVVWSPGEVWGADSGVHGREGRTLGLVAPEDGEENNSGVQAVLLTHEDYVGRTWAFSVLVLACMGVMAALYVAVYVALRVCDGTLTGPQVLGAVLLIGVMGTYASCVVYVLPPMPITCAVREWAPPMCLALCYGILLVKSMHLRALVSVGLGGEVSQVNLHVSLLFIMGVQGSLCVLGHAGGQGAGEEPLVKIGLDGERHCGENRVATLSTRIYLMVLLLITLVLGTLNRKIHRNHNEGRWLLLTSCVSAPVVGVWTVMSYMAPAPMEAPTTSVALLALASIILGLVFIPKMRIIAHQAKEFRHKQLAATNSVSTIFTQMDGGPLGGIPPLQDGLKPPKGDSPRLHQKDTVGSTRSSLASQQSYRAAFNAVYGIPQESPLSTPRHVMRNPIYDASHGAYP